VGFKASVAVGLSIAWFATGCGEIDANSFVDQPGEGCSTKVAPIVESTDFVPWESRLSHSGAPDELNLMPVSVSNVLPGDFSESLDGLGASAYLSAGGQTTVAYGPQVRDGMERSGFYSAGGLLLDRTQGVRGESIAEELARDPLTGDRVTLVAVGVYQAAVTWADPDARGIREHHVIWTDDTGQQWNLSGLRSAEELVGLAREMVC
jgi:hypothetical protein